jgi:23S rRNA pseudouridine2605 synthase
VTPGEPPAGSPAPNEPAAEDRTEGERLQKVLAAVGFGSRRACEDLVREGRVTVDGAVAVLGQRVDPRVSQVAVDGVPVSVRPGLVYYLLNKPRGVVTTASDPQSRPTVIDLVPPEPRVFPVGRLDADTEGLLILTNDGDLAHRLAHPSFGVEKEYLVEVESLPSPGELRRLRTGVLLEDGLTAPAKASLVPPRGIRLAIHEGRKHQVRRMCASIGHPVVRLVRTRIGPVADRSLAPGAWRRLRPEEVRALEESVALTSERASRTGAERAAKRRAEPGPRREK